MTLVLYLPFSNSGEKIALDKSIKSSDFVKNFSFSADLCYWDTLVSSIHIETFDDDKFKAFTLMGKVVLDG